MTALVQFAGHECKEAVPQRSAQRADRKARGLAEPDDDRPAGLGIRIEEHRARADLTRVEAHPAPFGQAGIERPVETRFGSRKSVANIMASEHWKTREGEVPIDYAQLDFVVMLRRRLLCVAHDASWHIATTLSAAARHWHISPVIAVGFVVRNERGWTQENLADRVGLSARYVGQIERAQASMSVTVLGRLANALKVDAGELVRRSGEKSS